MTEAPSHTPGPWTVDGAPDNQIVWSGPDNRVCFLAHSNGRDEDRDISNGRLIAAAPELLLALEELLHAYSEPDRRLCCDGRDCGCMGSTVHQQAEHYARSAIAKAKGGAA
ncbi:hypothetical protein [Neorhizobium sp. S3-V5DH]|uniref:hypothetical protein n=1 Tax=Neorhizobium sp. S3-V5DH TaxID=2485166 RepID=UPI00104BBD61|nr:hypothetical protein [Neorhizobium sp. S3-V5DH]TCV66323.1 hypothetical protein EDE09_11674 [Neorhizobium sp. S3-V5DH]